MCLGSYQLCAISSFGQTLLDELGIHISLGDVLSAVQRKAIISWYIAALEAIVSADSDFFKSTAGRHTEQLALHLPVLDKPLAVTFSGGVGELLYRHLQGETLPGTTHYGDLGIDLALAIAANPCLVGDANRLVPENRGRATVYGLTLHNTEISGTTLFLPRPEILPLKDLPIVARLSTSASLAQLVDAITLAARSEGGACLQLLDDGAPPRLDDIRQLGARLAGAIAQVAVSANWPLVLLLESNAGKALGNYASDWGRLPCNLVVIDEVRERHAHFINLGKPHQQIVPVAFYGVH